MPAGRAIARALAGVLLLIALPTPRLASSASEGHRFFLNGQPFQPDGIRLASEAGADLAPGDVIAVDGLWLTLGDGPEYRFRKAPEGVLIERPDGSTAWVGVRVEPTYTDSGRGFVDGLAPLTEAQVRGLWGLSAEVWNRSCIEKARWLDVERVFVSLGQTVSEGADDLPRLPPGLRRLEANRFVGWDRLSDLRQLEYLDLLPEHRFDLRRLAGLTRLRVLRIVSGTLEHVSALGGLTALERLQLRNHEEVVDVAFVRHLSRLREIDLDYTRVVDLTPLSGLAELHSIRANGAPIVRLPHGHLPALRSLDLMITRASEDDVAAFRRANPVARVHHRWNQSLREAIGDVTHVVLKTEPGCGGSDTAPREVRDAAEIATLLKLLVFEEMEGVGICGCLGGDVIELHRRAGGSESLQLVCGASIRWSGWPGDGQLPKQNEDALVEWLARQGLTGPRDERRATAERIAAGNRMRERAVSGMSPALRKVFEREVEQAGQQPIESTFEGFRSRLAVEVPSRTERIRILLRVLGADVGSWSGLGGEEQLADRLLRQYPRAALEKACGEALLGDDRQARRGAARLWDAWESPIEASPLERMPAVRSPILTVLQESRSPDLRQRAQSLVREWWAVLPAGEREERLASGLHDPIGGVRRRAMLVAGQAGAVSAEGLLLRVLAGETVETRPLPPVPPEDEDVAGDTSADRVGGDASDGEIAALALGYLRSTPGREAVARRARDSVSAHLRVARALLEERSELLVAVDFHTPEPDQALQLAAVEAVVRCGGRAGLELSLDYRSASHGWEPDQVAGDLRRMLLAADAPGRSVLEASRTLEQLRGWHRQYGVEFQRQVSAR